MDFGLSEDQLLLKQTIRRYLDEQCPTSRVRQIMEDAKAHDPDLWKGLVGLGIAGLYVPADQGGSGLELLDLALAAEELGYACTPGPFLATALAGIALKEGGSDAQRARWLPRLADGTALGTFALGEENGEWAPARLGARASAGKLTGVKSLTPYGSIADVIVVAAVDDAGPGLWLVEKGAPGLAVTDLKGIDATRNTSWVELKDVPAEKLPAGGVALGRSRDAACVLLAADSYGGCRRMLEMSVEYAKTREQFGQAIGAFQAVKHQLANLAAELEPTLSLWWYAAHAFDRIQEESERHAALAKSCLSDLYDRFARDCTELHGGIGFTWEYDLQLWFKRAMYNRAAYGDATFHRLRAADLAGW
jgi:alkylation response protein AidB-like acyl-CoA dehydrogenase